MTIRTTIGQAVEALGRLATAVETAGRPYSPADVVTVAEAVRRLPMRDADARRWLQSAGVVRGVLGRGLVVWGEVVDLIAEDWKPPQPTTQSAVLRGGLMGTASKKKRG